MAGKSDISKHVHNHMALVFCPKKNAAAPANATKETKGAGIYRCTFCGDPHRK